MFKKICLLMILCNLNINQASAFCGFYVAKADSSLFNKSSKVVVARNGDKTVITMANDYEGDLNEFAIVIPVPTIIKKEQVHITENAIIDHLDAYTSPRLVEYFDSNPCQPRAMLQNGLALKVAAPQASALNAASAEVLSVKIEEQYRVGEYDILILSAEDSSGLVKWLNNNDYRIPVKAISIIDSYLKQNMKFFVAKVNVQAQEVIGNKYLHPISIAFESPKFMLPIRLGTVNAKDTQELFIFMLTKGGRVEPTNYRVLKIPSDMNLPLYVKDVFSDFYRSMFDSSVKKDAMKVLYQEYAWDLGWCDPCAAEPMRGEELRELGVFWNDDIYNTQQIMKGKVNSNIVFPRPQMPVNNVFVTRLHLRYDAEHFPDDLMFQETNDKTNFQGKYIITHPWNGIETCSQLENYKKTLEQRFESEAQNLANLTGWDINSIRAKMKTNGQNLDAKPIEWYIKLWPQSEEK